MLYRKYKDFNECFFEINKEILKNPNLIEYFNPPMAAIDNLFIEVESKKCDLIDIGKLGYKIDKWNHLVKSYLGGEKIEELKHLGENIKGLNYAFDFLRKKKDNGSCIREIIISRKKRKSKWDTINIVWRTTELQRRFGVDLILISRVMELIPNADFKNIKIILPTAYQNQMYILPLVENVFNIKFLDLDENNIYIKRMLNTLIKYYIPEITPIKFLAQGQNNIDLYKKYERGDFIESITYEKLKLLN